MCNMSKEQQVVCTRKAWRLVVVARIDCCVLVKKTACLRELKEMWMYSCAEPLFCGIYTEGWDGVGHEVHCIPAAIFTA